MTMTEIIIFSDERNWPRRFHFEMLGGISVWSDSRLGDWVFNSPLAFVVRYGRQLFSTPALGCAIHCVPVTSDAAITLTAWDLPPFALWLAPLGPDSLCEGPKWLEPKLRRKL